MTAKSIPRRSSARACARISTRRSRRSSTSTCHTGFSNRNQRLPQTTTTASASSTRRSRTRASSRVTPCAARRRPAASATRDVGSLGEDLHGYGNFMPAQTFQDQLTEGVQRFIGQRDANWRPLAWMQNEARSASISSTATTWQLCRLNECPDSGTTRNGFGQRSARRQPQLLGEADEHLDVAGEPVGEPQDDGRRRLHEHRERRRRVERHQTSAGRADRRTGAVTTGSNQLADGDQDARPLRAGAGRHSRPSVPHGRRPHRSEQRVRHELPARLLSEGERVVDSLGRESSSRTSAGSISSACVARTARRACSLVPRRRS